MELNQEKLNSIDKRLVRVETNLDNVDNRLTNVETRLSVVEKDLHAVRLDVTEIKTYLPHLATKAELKDIDVGIEKSKNSIVVWLIGLILTSGVVNHFLFRLLPG